MTNKQFKFSLSIGFILLVLGSLMATQASIGISLLVLGASIIGLAFLTNKPQEVKDNQPLAVLISKKTK